ncbi:MAG: hypothetical protein A2033_07205 [Bacteroidetes bacterium GWA2_31_9]|nr:MAG: hypothetical protein A2033_07205 [Bacteroidetes bacterium GWA2_31_9]
MCKNSIIKVYLKVLLSIAFILMSSNLFLIKAQYNDSIAINLDTLNQPLKSETISSDTSKPTKSNKIDAIITYNAQDSIRFDLGNHKVYLFGNAVINYKAIELKADYIELDLSSDLIFAEGVKDSTDSIKGSPQFKDGDDQFNCKKLLYNFKSKKGLIYDVITEQGGGYLHSGVTKKQENSSIDIKHGKFTTCNLEHPHFYVSLTKAKAIPNDKIISGPAYLVIEDVSLPLGIPFGYFPNKKGHTSGLIIPEYGEELNRGFFLRNGGYYFAISDYVDLKLLADIYSRGSWAANVTSNYRLRYKFSGNVYFKYENVIVGESFQTNYKNTKTYWLKWNHRQEQKARPYSNFSANVDFGKSSFHKYSAYTDPNSYLQNTTQSNISYQKRFPNTPFNYSLNLRHSQNSLDSMVTLGLPEVALNMNRLYPFKRKKTVGNAKFYEKIGISYTSNIRNTVTDKDTALFRPEILTKMKNGMQHNIPISTSFNILKFVTVNPSFNYKEVWYLNSINRYLNDTNGITTDTIQKFVRAGDRSFNTSLSTKLYGMYVFKGEKQAAIRHVMTPSIGYSIRPDYSKSKFDYYRYYYADSSHQDSIMYSRFANGIFGSPPSGKSGNINFSLGNNVEMKLKSKKDTTQTFKKIMILESFSISSSYNLAVDSLKLAPFSINGRTTLFKKLNLNFSGVIEPYALDTAKKTLINKFEYNESGKIGRLTNANISVGFRLNSKSKSKTENSEKTKDLIGFPDDYVDFNIPWNVNIDYSYRYSKPQLEENITQSLRVSGDLSITSKWKISVSSGYDIKLKKFTFTNINIYRDLHCWEMRFTWIPFGFAQSYNFQINVKSAILQDLKLNKRSSWSNSNY